LPGIHPKLYWLSQSLPTFGCDATTAPSLPISTQLTFTARVPDFDISKVGHHHTVWYLDIRYRKLRPDDSAVTLLLVKLSVTNAVPFIRPPHPLRIGAPLAASLKAIRPP
jgi:hypothetical protein